VPPSSPTSTIQTARLGSAKPGCWLRVLNESTVTARSGIARESVFFTAIVSACCSARLCDDGNDALTTCIVKVPDGSLESCRSPPPHPATAKATTAVASPAQAPLHPVTARATYHGRKPRCAACATYGSCLAAPQEVA
jgi:hypothetical protein